jgi:NADPH-dependent curcumin reductase CurA
MSPKQYTQVVFNERPIADITSTTFRIEKVSFNLKPGAGEILVQVNWLSLDPVMRGWLRDTRSYTTPVQIGEVMRSVGLATVVEVNEGSKFQPGDVVQCMPGESPQYRCAFGDCAYGQVGRSMLSLKKKTPGNLSEHSQS